jgi:hypothetical protein
MKSTLTSVLCSFAFLAALLSVQASFSQKGETPPYDPAPLNDGMSAFTDHDLAITVLYPKEFQPGTPLDLQTVMERGHRLAFGSDPKSDAEHSEALRCMHTLLYATSGSPTNSGTPQTPEAAPFDSILLVDVDASCVPKKLKGDKALTNLAGTVLNSRSRCGSWQAVTGTSIAAWLRLRSRSPGLRRRAVRNRLLQAFYCL